MKRISNTIRSIADNFRSGTNQPAETRSGNSQGDTTPAAAPATELASTRANRARGQAKAFRLRLRSPLQKVADANVDVGPRSFADANVDVGARSFADANVDVGIRSFADANVDVGIRSFADANVDTHSPLNEVGVNAHAFVSKPSVGIDLSSFDVAATQYGTKDIKQSSMGALERMSDDLKIQIGSTMDPQTCKRFRMVSKQSSIWGAYALQHIRVTNPKHLKTALRTYGPGGIKSLTISGEFRNTHFKNRELQELFRHNLQALENLDVSGCSELTIEGVLSAVTHLSSLERLNMPESVPLDYSFGQHLDEIFASLPKLTHFNVRLGSNFLEPAEFMEIEDFPLAFTRVPNLKHLDLSSSENLDDEQLVSVLQELRALEYLNVSQCPWITGAGLASALQHTGSLKQLNVSYSNSLDDASLLAALRNVPALTYLNLSNSPGITDHGIADALQHVPQLMHLDISGCLALNTTNAGFASAMQHVPMLTHLNVANLGDRLTGEGLRMATQHLPKLKDLNVAGSFGLSDEGLAFALNNMPELEGLDASACSGLERLALPSLPSFKKFVVSICVNLKDIDLSRLPALEYLDLSGNLRLEAENLKHLLTSVAPTIEYLNIARLQNVTDEHLPEWDRFTKLQHLDLSLLDEITDKTVKSVPRGLDYLVVRGCDLLTEAALNSLPKSIHISQY